MAIKSIVEEIEDIPSPIGGLGGKSSNNWKLCNNFIPKKSYLTRFVTDVQWPLRCKFFVPLFSSRNVFHVLKKYSEQKTCHVTKFSFLLKKQKQNLMMLKQNYLHLNAIYRALSLHNWLYQSMLANVQFKSKYQQAM